MKEQGGNSNTMHRHNDVPATISATPVPHCKLPRLQLLKHDNLATLSALHTRFLNIRIESKNEVDHFDWRIGSLRFSSFGSEQASGHSSRQGC